MNAITDHSASEPALRIPFWRRWLAKPPFLIGTGLFAVLVTLTWFGTNDQAMRVAAGTLETAAADIEDDLRDCVDSLLFFQGDAICRHYGAPEKMTLDSLGEIMDRYGLDELNVVDRNGIVIRGALAEIGFDMGSNPKTAEFNCLLDGKTKTFSQRFRAPVENPTGLKRKYAGVAFDPPAKGYLQIGLTETRLKTRLDYFLSGLAEGWHIGDTGFFLIAKTETGEIVSSGRAFDGVTTLASLGFDTGVADASPGKPFAMSLGGIPCLCRSGIVNRYHRYVAAIPLRDIRAGARRTTGRVGGILLAVLLTVVFFMTRLSETNRQLTSFIALDRERRLKDLTLAKTIQSSSLPLVFPDEPDYKIFATMDTAREVGGDFYDFFPLPEGKVILLVADVSGKGVPAALFMMKAKALLRTAIGSRRDDLATAVAQANDELSEHNDGEMFVTAWIGAYDRRTGEVAYVNAGHNPPLVKRADGSVEWVRQRSGLVLAAMAGASYRVHRLSLAPGDSLFLYTDGITEAMDGQGRQYGEARLETALRANVDGLFVGAIRGDVASFVAGAERSDDMTMLALDVKRQNG